MLNSLSSIGSSINDTVHRRGEIATLHKPVKQWLSLIRTTKMASVNDLTVNQILDIKQRVDDGEFQHIVAADYHINQGRVNEIAKGKRFAMITTPELYVKRSSTCRAIPKGMPMFS